MAGVVQYLHIKHGGDGGLNTSGYYGISNVRCDNTEML